jgi:hypothetical protein
MKIKDEATEKKVMVGRGFFKNITFIFILSLVFVFSSHASNYSLKEALKVINVLEKIEASRYLEGRNTLRKIVISESELNSWIAYRIETEKEEVMKELKLKLFEENKVEGKIFIDLRGQNIPKILRPEMSFYFEGKLQIDKGRARFNLKKLFLEEQQINPLVLDLIIQISAAIQNFEASSIYEWYELPYGIKNIETHLGQTFLFY